MDQTAPQEEPLIHISGTSVRIRCPWCKEWDPEEAFIELQSPPDFPQQTGIVLKHRCGGALSSKGRIFTIRNYRRPAEAMA